MVDRTAMAMAVIAMVALPSLRALGQTRLGPIEVDADREPDDGPDRDAPSFVTVIDARTPSARVSSVADLIEREAGVSLRSLGGLGAFTAVSIRGSDPNEVAVFLDGVPLNRASAAAVDLSQLPAEGLERIEIYRGVPPLEFGSEAVGGAINLVTRKGVSGDHLRASVGGGSFGTRSAEVGASHGDRDLRVDTSAAYHGTTGDFTYYDYAGTLLDHSDDHISRRTNNGFDQLSLDATLAGGPATGPGTRWTLGTHGFLKSQGVPGRGYEGATSPSARLSTGRLIADGSLERTGMLGHTVDGRVDLYGLYERDLFKSAPGDQVGSFIAAATDNQTFGAGARGRLQIAAGAHELFTVLASVDAEHFIPHDLRSTVESVDPSNRVRVALGAGDDIRLFGDRFALNPALRFEGVVSDLGPGLDVRGAQQTASSSTSAFASPRLGARLRATPWLVIKGNVGWFQRLPTTVELFGDGGAFILPRPSLRPETSVSGDFGARLDLERPLGALSVEATLFGREVHGFITFAASGNALAAINLPDDPPVRMLGVETIVRARLSSFFTVAADYTFLHTSDSTGGIFADAEGKQLPFVPSHRLSLRAELKSGPLSCFYETLYTSDVWRDLQNTDGAFIPARALHSIGASAGPLTRYGITLTVEVRNLADLRIIDLPLGGTSHAGESTPYPLVDLFDYPLPGRAVYATLSVHN